MMTMSFWHRWYCWQERFKEGMNCIVLFQLCQCFSFSWCHSSCLSLASEVSIRVWNYAAKNHPELAFLSKQLDADWTLQIWPPGCWPNFQPFRKSRLFLFGWGHLGLFGYDPTRGVHWYGIYILLDSRLPASSSNSKTDTYRKRFWEMPGTFGVSVWFECLDTRHLAGSLIRNRNPQEEELRSLHILWPKCKSAHLSYKETIKK